MPSSPYSGSRDPGLPSRRVRARTRTRSVSPAPPSPPPPQVTSGFAALGVPDAVCRALASAGVVEPFPIQAATIADALAGRDVLGQGRTGSGKTVAFAVPTVVRVSLSAPSVPGCPQALVLAPTRELAMQIEGVMRPLAAALDLSVASVFGGVSHAGQRSALRSGVDVLVACPGRLLDLMGEGSVSLAQVEVCVLDEADMMADHGFLPQVRRILEAVPAGGQRMLFSATLADGVPALVDRFMTDPVTRRVEDAPPPLLSHRVLEVPDEGSRARLVAGLCQEGPTVVFCRTKRRTRSLARVLSGMGVPAVELHGNLSQPARTRNLHAFSSGAVQVLVATDIAARGIHVDRVSRVVHADPPADHTAYVHRSGRTARAGASGEVVTLASAVQRADVLRMLERAGAVPRAPVAAGSGRTRARRGRRR